MKIFKKETDPKRQIKNSVLILGAMAIAAFVGAFGFAMKANFVGMWVTSCFGFYLLGASVALAIVRDKVEKQKEA